MITLLIIIVIILFVINQYLLYKNGFAKLILKSLKENKDKWEFDGSVMCYGDERIWFAGTFLDIKLYTGDDVEFSLLEKMLLGFASSKVKKAYEKREKERIELKIKKKLGVQDEN